METQENLPAQPSEVAPPAPSAPRAPSPRGWPDEIPYHSWRAWTVRVILGLLGATAIFFIGLLLGRSGRDAESAEVGPGPTTAPTAAGDTILYWTCSMHPQIKLPKSGQCPICFMDLIPVRAGEDSAGEGPELALSARARMLARIETVEVQARDLTRDILMVGKVAADETRIKQISSYIAGRLDRVFVNYTGIFVRKGDHLVEIYSPELLVAQREYLLALDAGKKQSPGSEPTMASAASHALLEAARRKLELWGVPADEIERLARERQPTDYVRIDAPIEGWVLDRQGYEGMYVETGTRLFTLADLRTLWVMLDAYELDIGAVVYGQDVSFETEAYPGQVFTGRVDYIDPVMNEKTRTVRVRLNVPNSELRLRPGMFVRARVTARLGHEGRVANMALAGKWICPMHPEVVKDGPGQCDNCGMDLVTAESLGLVNPSAAPAKLLAVPQTAALLTGERAVVYVEKRDGDKVSYEGRVVQLGPRAGDYYMVRSGLTEGERVVTRGALMIDSALQIHAKPSMMSPAEEPTTAPAESQPARTGQEPSGPSNAVAGAMYHQHFRPVLAAYLDMAEALAKDDAQGARKSLATMREALTHLSPHGLEGEAAESFKARATKLKESLPPTETSGLDPIREKLPAITSALAAHLQAFGHDRPDPLARMFCPMAFDNRGAEWLQADTQVRNPYFANRMLRCGAVTGLITADGREEKPQ